MKQNAMKIKNTSRLGIFVVLGLLGLTILSASILSKVTLSAHADDYIDIVSVTVPASCNVSGYIDTENNKQHSATVANGLYQADIGETVITVSCNDNNGYSVYAIGYGENTDGTTTLKGTNTNLTIPTGTVTDASVSNWAMKLTAVSGTFTPTILSDTNGSYADYHVVPATATKVVTYTNSTNLSSSSQFKTTYAVGISNTQPADTYTGKVKYTLVHPNYANADGTVPEFLYDAIASMSKGNFDMSTINDTLTTPTSNDPTQDTSNSGVYKYTGNHSDGASIKDIYFYRGILDSSFNNATPYGSTGDGAYYPNYVKLTTTVGNTTTDTCWRIFRTTGSGGIKMLYNGTWDTTNNTCAKFNTNYTSTYYNRAAGFGNCVVGNAYCGTVGFATYVGYNYNSTYAYNNTSYTTAINNTELFNNETASNIRTATENWYTSVIGTTNNNLFESNAGYCNDRSTYGSDSATATETTTNIPYKISSTNDIFFGARHRLYTTNASPTLECPNTSGNDLLNGTTGKSYPVALITADELVLAGNGMSGKEAYSRSSFLTTGSNFFWSLSPNSRISGGDQYVFWVINTGNLSDYSSFTSGGLRPAISLAPGTLIMSGSGTAADPWIVQ